MLSPPFKRRQFSNSTGHFHFGILGHYHVGVTHADTDPCPLGQNRTVYRSRLRERGIVLFQPHDAALWRKQRDEGILQSLSRKRGRKKRPTNPLAKRLEELERENKQLRTKLNQAEMIIEVQKKFQRSWASRRTRPKRVDHECRYAT
jgi:hypothetical protein